MKKPATKADKKEAEKKKVLSVVNDILAEAQKPEEEDMSLKIDGERNEPQPVVAEPEIDKDQNLQEQEKEPETKPDTKSELQSEQKSEPEPPTLPAPSFHEKVLGVPPPTNREESSFESTRYEEENTRRKLFLLGILVFVITVAVSSAIGFFVINPNPDILRKKEAVPTGTPVPSPTEVVESFDKTEWVFEVLNGSGRSGEAAKARDSLEEMGFRVVSIGNSESSTTTQLFVAENLKGKTDDLLEELGDEFGEIEIAGTFDDQEATVRLIIGE